MPVKPSGNPAVPKLNRSPGLRTLHPNLVAVLNSRLDATAMPPTSTTTVVLDKSNDRIKRMFASIAAKYDLMNHLLSLNIDRRWRKRAVQAVMPDGTGPILDLCTGTGDLALEYWRATGGRFPIVGADFCREMLEVARRKSTALGVGMGIDWIEADAQALPFPDHHFQLVTIAFGIRNVADTSRGLQEIYRVCKPGGKIGILEFSLPRWAPLHVAYSWYFRTLLPFVGQYLARNDELAYKYLPSSVMEFPQGAAFAEQLQATGFEGVTYKSLTFGIATIYTGRKPRQQSVETPGDLVMGKAS